MTGQQFREIRHKRGLTVVQLGLLLGYQGNLNTVSKTVRGYEGRDAVPEHIGRLVTLIDQNWQSVPREWLFEAGVL
jgi:hypothetical protein